MRKSRMMTWFLAFEGVLIVLQCLEQFNQDVRTWRDGVT
jgi:hypothetical protein